MELQSSYEIVSGKNPDGWIDFWMLVFKSHLPSCEVKQFSNITNAASLIRIKGTSIFICIDDNKSILDAIGLRLQKDYPVGDFFIEEGYFVDLCMVRAMELDPKHLQKPLSTPIHILKEKYTEDNNYIPGDYPDYIIEKYSDYAKEWDEFANASNWIKIPYYDAISHEKIACYTFLEYFKQTPQIICDDSIFFGIVDGLIGLYSSNFTMEYVRATFRASYGIWHYAYRRDIKDVYNEYKRLLGCHEYPIPFTKKDVDKERIKIPQPHLISVIKKVMDTLNFDPCYFSRIHVLLYVSSDNKDIWKSIFRWYIITCKFRKVSYVSMNWKNRRAQPKDIKDVVGEGW